MKLFAMKFFSFLWLFLFGCCAISAGLVAAEKKFVVVIDPGHGGKDPGAVGSVLKVHEKKINLAVALELGALLEKEKNVEVVYTRKTDEFVPLDERPRVANKAKADIFISIHTNAAKSKLAAGAETYVVGSSAANMEVAMRENSVILFEEDYKTRYEGFDPNSSESYIMFDLTQFAFTDQSINLASCVQDQFKANCSRSDRGVKQAGFLVLKHSNMPSILVELGYISNTEEEAYLNKESSHKELAKSIYNAFLAYKANYEKKSVAIEKPKKEEKIAQNNEEKNKEGKNTDPPEIRYRIQFHASSKQMPLDSKEFKKLDPVTEYFENRVYKYMYGETSTYAEILPVRKEVQKNFKDAFIVVFKNGKKLTPIEARAYLK
jgi:N-acetylmuramoyl-L-alanine amidase